MIPVSEHIERRLAELPLLPGVYIMKNAQGKIIYIGKAKNLHNRVSSYFRLGADHLPKVARMVSHVHDYDFIVTGTSATSSGLSRKAKQKRSFSKRT